MRNAIQNANAHPGSASLITFSVGGRIKLASDLPAIATSVTIDGTTSPKYTGKGPVVEIDANGHNGLVFAKGSQGSALLAIAVGDAKGNGVTLNDGTIALNLDYIGLGLTGTPLANGGDGVYVSAQSQGNQIGSNAKHVSGLAANIISNNKGNGISLHRSSDNTIADNRIGTNPAGTLPAPNGKNGIWITASSDGNEIGGTVFVDGASGEANDPTGNKGTVTPVFVVPPLGNLISGNRKNGVLIDSGSANNSLNGNFIGTTADGDTLLANFGDGVWIDHADDNSLAGCAFVNNPFVYYNVISGNAKNGLQITSSNGVVVQGNFFGIAANNTNILGNVRDGILIEGSSQNAQVGGVIPLGNVSAGNGRNGIEVADTVSGFTTFNTFGGLLAFKGAAPNGNDGLLVTATGGNQTVRTNVFSGNANNGIEIAGDASGVTVDPNIAGLTTVGNAFLPNGNDGLLIRGTAHGNVIGGYTRSVIPQNTFSGNARYGVEISGQAYDNRLFNSVVGLNVLGTAPLGDLRGGIFVGGSAKNDVIGGRNGTSSKPLRNLVSGNPANGITLGGTSSYIKVIGNWIGLNRSGKIAIPNLGRPILVKKGSTHDTISGNVTSPPAH
ncbi:MAG TPA: hypothetical protein VNG31_02585 [Candidatus Baltobacteraceae bacterium]|nr:hypothetical protein [Candidatus Baltobacteraceae bacterium]